MLIVGIMSGTSLDGVDLAACSFWKENEQWKYEIVNAITIPYTQQEKNELIDAFNLAGAALIQLHHSYGNQLGEKIKHFCDKHNLSPAYIASHGHTLFHQPQKGFTFQLGHGANIAARSGIKTICDFRTTDVAYGGQGAPLVPIGDELLFSEYHYCLNLGGISNISFHENGLRKAFDIGICNMALNQLAQLVNLEYDKDGLVAASGSLEIKLLNQLVEVTQAHKLQKLSLGYEWYAGFIKPLLDLYECSPANKLNTFTTYVAMQIAKEVKPGSKVMVTGGGAKNTYLMQQVQKHASAQFILPSTQLIDFKEALLFAFLGLLRLNELPNSLSTVTGAIKNGSGGCIYLP